MAVWRDVIRYQLALPLLILLLKVSSTQSPSRRKNCECTMSSPRGTISAFSHLLTGWRNWCDVAGHNDDGIAIHGSYSLIVDVSKANETAARIPQQEDTEEAFQIWVTHGDYSVGNAVKLYDTAFRPISTVTVTAVLDPSP